MKLGLSFWGIAHAAIRNRDYRHCWPHIKTDFIDPFIAQGHEVKLYLSVYHFDDNNNEKEFYDLVKPDRVKFSHYPHQMAKIEAFDNFVDDVDAIVFTRFDAHWRRTLAHENIDYAKFNFLCKEWECWYDGRRYTNDNVYVIPTKFIPQARKAMEETIVNYANTHDLLRHLEKYIDEKDMHYISDEHELSDLNSFYSLCRERDNNHFVNPSKHQYLHPLVKERFYN